jgi:hypothetical protein
MVAPNDPLPEDSMKFVALGLVMVTAAFGPQMIGQENKPTEQKEPLHRSGYMEGQYQFHRGEHRTAGSTDAIPQPLRICSPAKRKRRNQDLLCAEAAEESTEAACNHARR